MLYYYTLNMDTKKQLEMLTCGGSGLHALFLYYLLNVRKNEQFLPSNVSELHCLPRLIKHGHINVFVVC